MMWPDWREHTAVVVASGASAKTAPLSDVRGRVRLIVVNESWRLAPWADVLYASDCKWWEVNNGVPDFKGLKFSASPNAAKLFPGIRIVRLVALAKLLLNKAGTLGCGSRYGNGHSGFHALNLAAQFGSRRIVLVGFDMCGAHWHGEHQSLPNPDAKAVAGWREEMDGCAAQIAGIGIDVVNASSQSALKNYPKMGLMEVIEQWPSAPRLSRSIATLS